MKTKNRFLPIIILVVAVLATAAYSIVSSIAKKPTVTEGSFPFSITYELDGETVTIKDVYKTHYVRNDGYADTKTRVYAGQIGDREENTVYYTLKQDGNTRVELWTHFYPDYLMGDPEYDYFDEEAFAPKIYYYDAEEIEYTDEETLAAQGVKLISFEYPTPIENTLVFSHLSYFSGEVVLPTLLIALLALLAIMIFVRKDKELTYQTTHILSIVFNWLVCTVYLLFVTIAAVFVDINGGGSEPYRQILYFTPAFSVLCVAASVALRRKGYGVPALVTTLIGPAVFVVYLVVCGICGLL